MPFADRQNLHISRRIRPSPPIPIGWRRGVLHAKLLDSVLSVLITSWSANRFPSSRLPADLSRWIRSGLGAPGRRRAGLFHKYATRPAPWLCVTPSRTARCFPARRPSRRSYEIGTSAAFVRSLAFHWRDLRLVSDRDSCQ